MRAHLFSEVYNLVVNVSFGPKYPRLGCCLEHIISLLEKNGLRVVLLHPSGMQLCRASSWLFLYIWQWHCDGQNESWEAGLVEPISKSGLSVKWAGSQLAPNSSSFCSLKVVEWSRRALVLFPVSLGFSSRSMCFDFIYLWKKSS